MSDTSAYVDDMIAWRRHLHMYPEASFDEHETVKYLEQQIAERMPSAKVERVTETSLVAVFACARILMASS